MIGIEKSYLAYPKCKSWALQKMGVLVLSFLPLPTRANDGDTLLTHYHGVFLRGSPLPSSKYRESVALAIRGKGKNGKRSEA